MRAHELAKLLLSRSNLEVEVSIDISKGEEDFDRRAFGQNPGEIIESGGVIVITMTKGYVNNETE